MDKKGWGLLARKRLISVLGRHGIACARTLEQKISDAGPNNQRIDPHVLTSARIALIKEGEIITRRKCGAPWFHLANTPEATIQQRLEDQLPIFSNLRSQDITMRIGQCLEIAIYKALLKQNTLEHFGSFANLDDHDDNKLYSKEEPPQSVSGRRPSGKKRLDFIVHHPQAGFAGIEAKNVREWLYPNRKEITELLGKAVALDCVPVLIGRRIPFVTFKVLSACGIILHQTYNQLLPEADRELAKKAKDKRLLGYHDIRVGNDPDTRLLKFIGTNLPRVLPRAREQFDEHKDLIGDFAVGTIEYEEFAARVRRRSRGTNEDSDWDTTD